MLVGTSSHYCSHFYVSCSAAGSIVTSREGGEAFPRDHLVASCLPAFAEDKSAEAPIPGDTFRASTGVQP